MFHLFHQHIDATIARMIPGVDNFEKFTLYHFFGGEEQENFTSETAETSSLIAFVANDKDAVCMFKFFAGLS